MNLLTILTSSTRILLTGDSFDMNAPRLMSVATDEILTAVASCYAQLGHVEVGLTYWYIEAVPELLALATKRLGSARQPGGAQ